MRSRLFWLSVVVVGFASVGANGAAIAWTNSSGSNSAFDWLNGDSGEGLWGDPVVSPAGFVFDDLDPAFAAGAVDHPGSDSVVSSMHVRIDTTGRDAIHTLHVYESGTYTGTPADVSGSWAEVALTFLNPVPLPIPFFQAGNLDFTFNPDGTWEAVLDVNFGDLHPDLRLGAIDFNLEVTNHLHAAPIASGTSAGITKDYVEIWVPEPATMTLGLLGGLAMFARRPVRRVQ